jgi:hypothetical protein
MLFWLTKPNLKTSLQYLVFITLMLSGYSSAQGFDKHSLSDYLEQKAYPLSLDKKYDFATVESVTGKINKLFYVEYYYFSGSFRILGLELETNQNEIYQIHLAPLIWLNCRDVPIHKGAQLTVKGSIVSTSNESVLIAGSLSWQGKKVDLRRRDGQWLWDLQR